MIVYGEDYVDKGEQDYLQKQEERQRKQLIKNAKKLGFTLVDADGVIV